MTVPPVDDAPGADVAGGPRAPVVTPAPRSWWARNRVALLVLPVALALALVASGDRVRTLWWQTDLRIATTAAPGATAHVRQQVLDGAGGSYPVDVRVRLDGVTVLDADAPLPPRMVLPPGAVALRVDLAVDADPDVVLTACRLAVRDADGTRYDYAASAAGGEQDVVPCVPGDAPGPAPSLGEELDSVLTQDETPRPAAYTVSRVVVLPAGVEPADVVLWWALPTYVELEVAAGTGTASARA